MNKICVYAICKNEIKFIDSWLNSMSEADYIVVLDTGSTDGTFERLQGDSRVTHVEKLEISPFRFDIARNESMKLAPEDANILLCTDFDEILEPGWANKIRDNWTKDTWRGHYRYVWSHNADGSAAEMFTYDKLHNRRYHWMFPVHEVLLPIAGEQELNTEKQGHIVEFGSSIVLHHYPDKNKDRSNYLDLLNLRVVENPNDPYSFYLLGREYGTMGEYSKAYKYLEHTILMDNIDNYPLVKYCSLGYLGDLSLLLNNIQMAIMYYSQQIIIDSSYREPYLNLAEIYNHMGLYSVAISMAESCLTRTYRHYDWTERSSTWREKLYDILSLSYYFTGEIDKGIENAIKALQLAPMDNRIQMNYLALLSKKSEKK